MLPPRAGLNLASTFARTTAFRRAGHQLAGRSYAKSAAPIRSSSLLLYATLAGAGIGLHAYNLNSTYCDSMRLILLSLSIHIDMPPESDSQRAPLPVMAPPPATSLGIYGLTFGSVCGICAGLSIKIGSKLVVSLLGTPFEPLYVMPISRPYALFPKPDLFFTSTSYPPLSVSLESTGLVPQAGSRIRSTERRTALDALTRSDPSSTLWLQISSHRLLSQLG
jgi:hypothetical protein